MSVSLIHSPPPSKLLPGKILIPARRDLCLISHLLVVLVYASVARSTIRHDSRVHQDLSKRPGTTETRTFLDFRTQETRRVNPYPDSFSTAVPSDIRVQALFTFFCFKTKNNIVFPAVHLFDNQCEGQQTPRLGAANGLVKSLKSWAPVVPWTLNMSQVPPVSAATSWLLTPPLRQPKSLLKTGFEDIT
jgi:hypothetical protein